MGSTTDKISGVANQAAGKVKETAGKVTGSKELEAEGLAQEVKGTAEKLVGEDQSVAQLPKFRVACIDGGELGDQSNHRRHHKPSASVNELNPQKWRTDMTSSEPEDFAADFAALRDDVTKLSSSFSDYIRK